MFTFYLLLKYIHILSAIVAVGANITYGVWSFLSQREPAHLGFTLKGIRWLDNRIANPAYGVLFLSGVALIIVGRVPIKLWIIAAVIIFVAIAAIGGAVFTPLVRRQIALVEAGDTSSPEFERLSRRNSLIGPLLGVLVLIVLAMMVFKPG